MESKEKAEDSYAVAGQLMPTTEPRKISDFVPVNDADTPGNVGICLSGGGSVAMISALGQLRALVEMGVLEKARAISTVSGGSWATVPFIYLPAAIDDATFLGPYEANPNSLTLNELSQTPEGYMGSAVAAEGIVWTNMAKEAAALLANKNFPNNRIWNYLIARHILQPFGLAEVDVNPNEQGSVGGLKKNIAQNWFAHSESEADNIKAANPDLQGIPYYVYAGLDGSPNRVKRPYHLCNSAMFITPDDPKMQPYGTLLAPLQCTAIGTGVFQTGLGKPFGGKETGSQDVGGGLVSSQMFNSTPTDLNADDDATAVVAKGQLFSLADITANSSAFYATLLTKLASMDPAYDYWPVKDAVAGESFLTQFADGGAIDNNGLLNLLAYDDIDKAIVFTNALKSISIDGDKVIEDYSNLEVDTWLPPYFGYTPYQSKKKAKNGLKQGYNLYADLDAANYDYADSGIRYYRQNQIFPSEMFWDVLRQLWYNCCNTNPDNKDERYQGVSYYHNTSMPVQANDWFGISARNIELLLVHYGPYKPFGKKLKTGVAAVKDAYVAKNAVLHGKAGLTNPVHKMWPNFILTETHMPANITNLFAHYTSYVTTQLEDTIKGMFS